MISMKKLLPILLCAAFIIVAATCSKKTVRLALSEQDSYARVSALYEKSKLIRFLDESKYFLSDYPASKNAPKVQYWIGEAHTKRKEYEEAIYAYQRVIDKYSDSEYLDDAYYKIGEAFFVQKLNPQRDQTASKKAIYYYEKVIQLGSPFSEDARAKIRHCRSLLAQKQYYIARFYLRSKQYDTSLTLMDEAISNFSDTPEMSYFYYLKAMNYFKQKDTEKTRAMLAMMEQYKPFDATLTKYVAKLEKKLLQK